MLKSGIYGIKNTINEKIYVGSTLDIKRHWCGYKSELRDNRHRNKNLQKDWCRYGEKAFTLVVLRRCPTTRLLFWEQVWINYYAKANRKLLYNVSLTAGSILGYRHDKETRQRMKVAQSRKVVSQETRLRMSLSAKKRANTTEGKARLVAQSKELASSPYRQKQNSKTMKDRSATPEGQAHLARMRKLAAMPEAKEKQASKIRGRKASVATRAKLSTAQRLAWVKRKSLVVLTSKN